MSEALHTSQALRSAKLPHHLLAVIGPLVVLAAALGWLTHTEPSADEPVLSDRAAAMARVLAKADPLEVVVIGNSTAQRGVDTELLAEELGIAPDNVRVIFETGSRAPAWYALLDNRVFRAGHRPDLVLVLGEYRWMVETQPHSDEALTQIQEHLGEDPGVVGQLTFGRESTPAWLRQARLTARNARAATLDGIRDVSVGWLLTPPDERPLAARGRAHAEAAMESLFGAVDAVDMSLHQRVVPVVEVDRESLPDAGGQTPVSEGYVPELVELAQAHGSQIVFVRVPLPTANPLRFAVPNEQRRALVALLNETGAGWLDLSEVEGIRAASFADGVHLDSDGRQVFTTALAAGLQELGALREEALADAALPEAPPVAERSGTPPAVESADPVADAEHACLLRYKLGPLREVADAKLQRRGLVGRSPVVALEQDAPLQRGRRFKTLGTSCDGSYLHPATADFFVAPSAAGVVPSLGLSDELPLVDKKGRQAWWVYPGTKVRFSFAEPLAPDEDPLEADVAAVSFGPGEGVPQLLLGGQSTSLKATGDVWRGEVISAAPADHVTVSVPTDGPFLLLSSLSVSTSDTTHHPVLASRTGPSQLALFGSGTDAVPSYASAPPTLELGPITEVEGIAQVEVPALAGLDPTRIAARLSKPCSAVIVRDGGTPLAKQAQTCARAQRHPGVACQQGATIGWSAPDGRSPTEPAFTVALDPARACRTGRWLFPGDQATVSLSNKQVRAQPLVSRAFDLEVHGFPDGDPDGPVELQLSIDGAVVLAETVPLSSLADRRRWRLPAPVIGLEEIALTLSTSTETQWAIVTYAALVAER